MLRLRYPDKRPIRFAAFESGKEAPVINRHVGHHRGDDCLPRGSKRAVHPSDPRGLTRLTPPNSFSLPVTTMQSFASAIAAMIASRAPRGRPLALPSAISLAHARAAFSSNAKTRPANNACGPSGPENHASSSRLFLPAGFSMQDAADEILGDRGRCHQQLRDAIFELVDGAAVLRRLHGAGVRRPNIECRDLVAIA
jgi:hypothetical protein